jgi:hypothetical protein
MRKISGIIPSSARVTSTDLSAAKAVRPGVPDFGAPIGSSALSKASLLPVSAVDLVRQVQEKEMSDAQRKESANVDIVSKMADNFFMNNRKSAAAAKNEMSATAALPQVIDMLPPEGTLAIDSMDFTNGDQLVKGGYLDVEA